MEIVKEKNGSELIMKLSGRIDTVTSIKLSKEIEENIEGLTKLIFDASDVMYISSATMRVFLQVSRKMEEQGGKMQIINVIPEVMNIFDMIGFIGMLDIQGKAETVE